MKYIKATIYLLFGIIKALISWVIFLPFAIFTMPVDLWNIALYGKPKTKSAKVKDLGDKIEIILPNGERIVGTKVMKVGGGNGNDQKEKETR